MPSINSGLETCRRELFERRASGFQNVELLIVEPLNGPILKSLCTRAKSGRRMLVVGLRRDLVQKRREQMRAEGFSQSMHPRNGIEGTHSELVRGHGLRRTNYRGFNRVGLAHYLMGAACNVKRYLRQLAFHIQIGSLNPA
ncbi:MAG: transposase [Candidatus Binatia bacterium]